MTAQPISKIALICAGGTGGHIFPGIAVAKGLQSKGWQVEWLGTSGEAVRPSMESQLVPQQGFRFHGLPFGGLRGQGVWAKLMLPWRLFLAGRQAWKVILAVNPGVVLGFGGYPSVPGCLAARLSGKPTVIHEQNSVPGLANRLLARWAAAVFSAFPDAIQGAVWVGNPLRSAFLTKPDPKMRFEGRTGALRVFVTGGSQGASVFNRVVPQALSLLPLANRPIVKHQCGRGNADVVRQVYRGFGLEAEVVDFVEDPSQAMADADVVICRAGASTVTEIAALGVAAIFVPFPQAVDDHQTGNANYLVDQAAGWLMRQDSFDARRLAEALAGLSRDILLARAVASFSLAKLGATERIVEACEVLLGLPESMDRRDR
ncbi:MAG: undecaprenyldiphospho-muramoylpentapeptide beta-N-acetylglucosaminyltransferase [Pseudomonadota bacterium]|jgi:UDP-N-acetylglucosamine--N-acetylmuramyl-(pentapeptide) pyrophosphoryl-undecaprenol N-acetylglucosamine transferase